MAKPFYLMRKNEIVTLVSIEESGHIGRYSSDINEEIAPLQSRYKPGWLKEWWADRAVPVTQKGIKDILKSQGLSVSTEYLVKNLGLSLTDYYWIKPLDSDLTWENVNLFDNDFKSNLNVSGQDEFSETGIPAFSPNSSIQGDIEKSWCVKSGKRFIIKGNRTYLSAESINEVIAGAVHKCLGYDNYTKYSLVRIENKEYNFGCMAKIFTSQDYELIPAYAIYTYKKKANNISPFNHFMQTCSSLGADVDMLQSDMDHMIMTDFILSQYDRHLNNFGLLRDAGSLKITRLAPIYDSGACLFVNNETPGSEKELLRIKINSFAENELSMLKYVKDKGIIDLTKLPPASFIKESYGIDNKMDEKTINRIAYLYEKKIDICRRIQLGEDPMKNLYGI